MNTKKIVLGAALAVALSACGYYAHSMKENNEFLKSSGNSILATPTSYTGTTSSTAPVDFGKAAEQAVPSVVHIKTITKARQIAQRGGDDQNPFGDFGGDDFFRKFFGDNGRSFSTPEQRASGSGVIVSNDGYIVTNNHVVDGATDITVTLNDDHKTYKAKVIGTDPNTDLALIKVDAKNLPVMSIGNSDDVHLGQWVLAIGYPLNLDVTVTQGIVSAKSRSIGINTKATAPVEAFIQTDAAVNPGSSGGALVNTNGELIGINAAIASPTGSYAGYAYSIPSNLMKKVIGDLMKYGMVQRGYLGISMAPENLDDAKKKELGINDDVNGVYVAEVDPQGAAAAAGIQKGDAITKVNDVAVSTGAQLSEQIARQKPGDVVKITLLRGSSTKTINVTLKGKMGTFPSQQKAAILSLGAELSTVSKENAAKMNIAGGVQVTGIKDEGIISAQTNMKEGFVITKINGRQITSVEEFKAALNNVRGNIQLEGKYPGDDETYYYGINGFGK